MWSARTHGSTDVYCYACNDARLDHDLAAHLAAFGINIQTQTKTEKSMTELVRICTCELSWMINVVTSANRAQFEVRFLPHG